MTSKVNNLSDQSYITSVFNKLEDRQKQCIILVDEVYVKCSLFYHGGQLFEKAHNNEDEFANAVLGIMIKCLFGGSSFLFKIVSVKLWLLNFCMNKSKQHLPLFTMQAEFPLQLLQIEIELTRSSSTCLKPSPVSLGLRQADCFCCMISFTW